MNDGKSAGQSVTRKTRADQKDATRQAIVDAAVDCLTTNGYASVRTREVAHAANVAQGTVTYHFPSRETLLQAAVAQMIDSQVTKVHTLVAEIPPEEVSLDRALGLLWDCFLTPEGLASAHLWNAAWSEPDLVPIVRDLEGAILAAILDAGRPIFGDREADLSSLAHLDLAFSAIRGLVQSIPIHGISAIRSRWESIKQVLVLAAAGAGYADPISPG